MADEEVKKCKVEFLPDNVLGWVFKPGLGCEEVLKKISERQGPHSQRYLNVRKRENAPEPGHDGEKSS
jgi:hypothetical protein